MGQRNRLGAAAAVLALHLSVLSLGLLAVWPRPSVTEPQSMLVVAHLADARAAPDMPQPLPNVDPVAPVLPEPPEIRITPSAPDQRSADRRNSPPGGCATLSQVAAALAQDTAVAEAAGLAPADARSVARAIVVWNRGWSAAALADAAPLAPVRLAVGRALASVPQDCIAEVQSGPRFVPVATAQGTTVLVFGSGSWAWQDLLAGG